MKTTLKVLAPFGTAVITVIVFYLLGVVFLLLGFIFNLFDLDAILDIFDNIINFCFLFSGEYPLGSTVVSIIFWIIITIIVEILIEDRDLE